MTQLRKLVLAGAVAGTAATPAALGAPPISSARFWRNEAHTVTCGKRIDQKNFQLLCSAQGIPRPQGGGQGGDPFVVLRRTGRPELVLLSQDEFPSGHPQTLTVTTVWQRNGLVCNIQRKGRVYCFNKSNHGFTIGNGKYRSF